MQWSLFTKHVINNKHVIKSFGFEGWIWDLIASVPDLCIPLLVINNIGLLH